MLRNKSSPVSVAFARLLKHPAKNPQSLVTSKECGGSARVIQSIVLIFDSAFALLGIALRGIIREKRRYFLQQATDLEISALKPISGPNPVYLPTQIFQNLLSQPIAIARGTS